MKIQDMHYDFKKKLNKVDTNQNRNLLIPEIDWVLNEAMEIYIKNSASPRKSSSGVEYTQRVTDDLYPIIVKDMVLPLSDNKTELPEDYMFFVRASVLSDKGSCSNVESRLMVRQHDDMFEESPFTKSSLEWREINGTFSGNGITTYTDGSFQNNYLKLTYLRRPRYMHFASGLDPNGYYLPSGVHLTGSVDCELPEHTHRIIVDLAVAITSGELHYPDYPNRLQKLQILDQFQ